MLHTLALTKFLTKYFDHVSVNDEQQNLDSYNFFEIL